MYALVGYLVLDSIGLVMVAGKRVRYRWPLVVLCLVINAGWIVVAAEAAARLR